jgi:enoyl-CoA hydratase/carnithine racemase
VSDILVERADGLATVTFNRPRVRNAISLAMWSAIARITGELSRDDAVRAIVYRGAGVEAFASGADISEFTDNRRDTASAIRYGRETHAAYEAIRYCPKPTVAMVFGFCMGGAMAIAMACDLRFAAEGATFGIPAARLSIVYGVESVAQLVDLVGPAYAKDILYSARAVPAAEALRIGFIQRLLPVGELERYTYDYLAAVAANAPLSVRAAKVAVQYYLEGLDQTREKHLTDLATQAYESHDYREGTRAFLEKRPPRFTGR